MKMRYYQPQTQWIDTTVVGASPKYRWYDDGPAILQYYTDLDGFWQDVDVVKQSEEAQYNGEREMR